MKRFLLKIGLLFLIVAVLDVLAGKVLGYLFNHTESGDYGRNNYICNKTYEDILVFGSSRALHHYNPAIIEDSLDLTCYNCGQRSVGIILHYGRFRLIRQRYYPRILIYDVHPFYDLYKGEDNHKYLGWLRLYYDYPCIQEIFTSVDFTEKYKMMSQMYRYNSRFLQILFDYTHPLDDVINRGFKPINKKLDSIHAEDEDLFSIDTLKISYLKKLIAEAKDTKIIFVVSPYWNGIDTTSLQLIKDICLEQNISFFDFSNDSKYVHNNEYFYDGVHLNARGADEFTRDFVQELKKREVIGDNEGK